MHLSKKGNQWYLGMKVHAGVDKDSGMVHSVVVTAPNVHDLTLAADLLHGDEEEVMATPITRVSPRDLRWLAREGVQSGDTVRHAQALPDTPDGNVLDLIETAKAHMRWCSAVHLFRACR